MEDEKKKEKTSKINGTRKQKKRKKKQMVESPRSPYCIEHEMLSSRRDIQIFEI